MTDATIYRNLYRSLITEAIGLGIVTDAAEFSARALADVDAGIRVAARAGDVDAMVAICDAGEQLIEANYADPDDHGYPEPDEDALERQALWVRACNAQIRYRP